MSKKPISPHLGIYKPQLTSVLSIMHRLTGAYLYFGIISFAWIIFALVYYPDCLQDFSIAIYKNEFSRNIMKLALFAWTFSLFYHLFNGIRHLFWDAGKGFEIKTAYRSGKLVILVTILCSVFCWYLVYKNFTEPKYIDYKESDMKEEEVQYEK